MVCPLGRKVSADVVDTARYTRVMDLPPPDVEATEVGLDSLDGTAKSIARAAVGAGYTVRATRALGPRVPKLKSQGVERIGSLTIVGIDVAHGHRFTATWNARDGWGCIEWLPGWPTVPTSILGLRARFKALTGSRDTEPKTAA